MLSLGSYGVEASASEKRAKKRTGHDELEERPLGYCSPTIGEKRK
jgi:hypothetical protein